MVRLKNQTWSHSSDAEPWRRISVQTTCGWFFLGRISGCTNVYALIDGVGLPKEINSSFVDGANWVVPPCSHVPKGPLELVSCVLDSRISWIFLTSFQTSYRISYSSPCIDSSTRRSTSPNASLFCVVDPAHTPLPALFSNILLFLHRFYSIME